MKLKGSFWENITVLVIGIGTVVLCLAQDNVLAAIITCLLIVVITKDKEKK